MGRHSNRDHDGMTEEEWREQEAITAHEQAGPSARHIETFDRDLHWPTP